MADRVLVAISRYYKHIADELALPPVKIHCSVLAEDAIAAAIADIKAKRAKKSDSEALAS